MDHINRMKDAKEREREKTEDAFFQGRLEVLKEITLFIIISLPKKLVLNPVNSEKGKKI